MGKTLNLNFSPVSAFTCSVTFGEIYFYCGPQFHQLQTCSSSKVERSKHCDEGTKNDNDVVVLCG